MNSPPLSPSELDETLSSGQSNHFTPRVQKRNSFEVLHGLAGPDSNLPLPRRDERRSSFGEGNEIREGIPTSSGTRAPSPTRTLSRIPVSSVGNARALAEEGQQDNSYSSNTQLSPNFGASSSSLTPATSPSRRTSFAPGNTTKVLADLQAGVLNAKNALENTKAQLRVSQRQVSQLTRQTEDLKEVRERLRMENEGLNNVVARKERLLQELKLETTNSKKSIRDMDSTLADATARSQKAEREYVVLRDSLKGLVASFQADTDSLREEMRRREEKVMREAEEMGKRYRQLVEEVRKEREEGGAGLGEVKQLKEKNDRIRKEVEESFREDIEQLRAEVEKSGKESEEAWRTAKSIAEELARLRRLMRAESNSAPSAATPDVEIPV